MSVEGFRSHGPATLPLRTAAGIATFDLTLFSFGPGDRWVAATYGDVDGAGVPLRIESACVFGHVFGSIKCDCAEQLHRALATIVDKGRGLVIYGVDQDARGAGIETHFDIYDLRQRQELDTDEVYDRLQVPLDGREYGPVVAILRALSITTVTLMTNNSGRIAYLRDNGIEVDPSPLEVGLTPENMGTLMLAKEDLGYDFSFRTHSAWLEPLQRRVDGDGDRRAAELVIDGRSVAEYFGHDWDVAAPLSALLPHRPAPGDLRVLYLTDYPRLDELRTYSDLGVAVIVLPFPRLPLWLRDGCAAAGIALQDWARGNRYNVARPQWELVASDRAKHVYARGSETRTVPLDEVPSTMISDIG